MASIDFAAITRILDAAHADGRSRLFEHECYEVLRHAGAEQAPANKLVAVNRRPTAADLESIPGDRVVLKVVSDHITHKTEAGGVRVVAKQTAAVAAAWEQMVRDVPVRYAAHLDAQPTHRHDTLTTLHGDQLAARLSEGLRGVLVCGFVEADARGIASELFVGIRETSEFGPIISAGLGGVEMELLAERTQPGAAVVIAPTGMTDGTRFLELFKQTLSYQKLSGEMRGSSRLVADPALGACFQSFVDIANHFSEANPDARFHLTELEVNPFVLTDGRLAPLDGVCAFRSASRGSEPRPIAKISHLLKPRSAAVIGVSERGMNMGRIILNNLFDAGFDRRRAYVVRPGADEIDGAACFSSIADLPEKVDLFVVAISATQVPAVVTELIEHDRANSVILIPGGLGEKEGSQELEKQLKGRIRAAHRSGDGGPVFLGGNSLGVISHPGRYDTMFIPESKLAKSRGDRVRKSCFISQSGAFIITNSSRLAWLDPAYSLSIGNQIDLTASDVLSHVKDDPAIEVFAVYMEGFQPGDGLAFAGAVRETVALGKDVVFYKAGRTTEGRGATAGHTASVAGDYAVCEAAVSQAGALVADDFNEFSDLLNLAVHLRGKPVRGRRLAAISNAGFESVGMADSIDQGAAELQLVGFSPDTAAGLADVLAQHRLDGLVDVKNPLDVTPMATDAAYANLVAGILEDHAIDLVVAGIVPLTPAMQTLPEGRSPSESIANPESIANTLPAIAGAQDKPVVAVVDSGARFDPLAERLREGGLPVFRSADRAVRVLCRYVDAKLRER